MSGIERCPHCHAAMGAWTNGFGGVYMQCFTCGHYESVSRQPDPYPSIEVVVTYADGRSRRRLRNDGRVPSRGKRGGRRGSWSKDDGLRSLRERATALGRTPFCYELGDGCPHESWFRNNFGTFAEAVIAAGLTPRRRGNHNGKNGQAA